MINKIQDAGEVAEDDLAKEFNTADGVTWWGGGGYGFGNILCMPGLQEEGELEAQQMHKCSTVQCIDHCNKQFCAKLVFSAGEEYLTLKSSAKM